jgi:hypothetical protein
MIYSVKATKAGIHNLLDWDGSNNNLTYLDASILAVSCNPISIGDLGKALVAEYPMEITDRHLTEKLLSLERRGFVTLLREITSSAVISVHVFGLFIHTSFGEFVQDNRQLFSEIHTVDRLKKQLMLDGHVDYPTYSLRLE